MKHLTSTATIFRPSAFFTVRLTACWSSISLCSSLGARHRVVPPVYTCPASSSYRSLIAVSQSPIGTGKRCTLVSERAAYVVAECIAVKRMHAWSYSLPSRPS